MLKKKSFMRITFVTLIFPQLSSIFFFGDTLLDSCHLRDWFGVCKQTLSLLWEHLSLAENSSKIEHLLYMLHFFKQYQTEDAAAIFWKITPKTLRKHIWNTIEIFHRTLHTVRK